jgi:type III pantothenate kinase
MILELDMGNTRIKWRLYSESGNVARGKLASASALSELSAEVRCAAKKFEPGALQQVRIVSVLDDARNRDFSSWCFREFGVHPVFAVSQVAAAGVINGYFRPEQLGTDRWLAIIAGFALARRDCVIVDCGSAITVDIVTAEGKHLGGYIAPGLRLLRHALLGNTQRVKISDLPTELTLSPGCDTDAGVASAQGAMVYGLVIQAITQLNAAGGAQPLLIVTGGDAEWLLPHFPEAILRPELVLDGLVLALADQNESITKDK